MVTDPIGLYVHIPYCVRKCNYCDFCSLPVGSDNSVPDEYVDRLIREIRTYKAENKVLLSTVYIGGGTPSLLTEGQLEMIFAAISDSFDISDEAEITMEVNPGTLTFEKAVAIKNVGVNRVSIGLQSIHENELKKLGRIHNCQEFLASYKLIRDVGIRNVNIDLMYGIPYQTSDSFASTLNEIGALAPEHISAYGLIVEEGTPFGNEGNSLPLPTTDEECDMYDICRSVLSSFGYNHYEISNYALPGYESRHNLLYWHMNEYIGVGVAAHSYYGGKRYSNTADVNEYITSPSTKHIVIEETDDDLKYEYAMLGLRLKEGVSLSEYSAKFGVSFTEGKEDIIARLSREGLLRLTDDRISLTERGFYLSNAILVEIL